MTFDLIFFQKILEKLGGGGQSIVDEYYSSVFHYLDYCHPASHSKIALDQLLPQGRWLSVYSHMWACVVSGFARHKCDFGMCRLMCCVSVERCRQKNCTPSTSGCRLNSGKARVLIKCMRNCLENEAKTKNSGLIRCRKSSGNMIWRFLVIFWLCFAPTGIEVPLVEASSAENSPHLLSKQIRSEKLVENRCSKPKYRARIICNGRSCS